MQQESRFVELCSKLVVEKNSWSCGLLQWWK